MIALVLILLVAFLHFYFMTLEMFFWTKPAGLKAFRQSLEKAQSSKVLAQNQGLYNGFLAVGLMWGALSANPDLANPLRYYFLGCVVVAGVYGAITVGRKILYVQALPAVLALVALNFGV